MKNITFISLFLSTINWSCSKEITTVPSNSDAPNPKELTHLKAAENIDFKYDFLRPFKGKDVPPRVRPTDLENQYKNLAQAEDPNVLKQQYPAMKAQLIEWSGQNDAGRYSWVIEIVALHYLRNYFLLDPSPASDSECAFLLEILIKDGAIDLDVLADAYKRAENLFDKPKRTQYYDYIEALYNKDLMWVREWAPKLKQAYEKGEGNKMILVEEGKKVSRRSLSCRYARDLLGLKETSGS